MHLTLSGLLAGTGLERAVSLDTQHSGALGSPGRPALGPSSPETWPHVAIRRPGQTPGQVAVTGQDATCLRPWPPAETWVLCPPPAPSGLSPSRVCLGLVPGPALSSSRLFPQKLFGFLLEYVGDLATDEPPDLRVIDKLVV